MAKETAEGTAQNRYDGLNLIQEADGDDELTKEFTVADETFGDLVSEFDDADSENVPAKFVVRPLRGPARGLWNVGLGGWRHGGV